MIPTSSTMVSLETDKKVVYRPAGTYISHSIFFNSSVAYLYPFIYNNKRYNRGELNKMGLDKEAHDAILEYCGD